MEGVVNRGQPAGLQLMPQALLPVVLLVQSECRLRRGASLLSYAGEHPKQWWAHEASNLSPASGLQLRQPPDRKLQLEIFPDQDLC